MRPEGKGTILIVDDEPDVVFFITKICQPQGYHTLTAGSGPEALNYVKELRERIDLVLLDLRMPGMNGVEVLKEIRKVDLNLPVIILTALTDQEAACRSLGIVSYIVKPYSLERLYQEMTGVLGKKGGLRRTPTVPAGSIPTARVLIVDDEEEVCDLLSEALTDGVSDALFEVRTARSGEEALKISNEFEPDIAIIDIKMPYMWGDELIERFKSGAAHCPKDFVIFTGGGASQETERARKSAHKVLMKPGNIDELVPLLKEICVRHGLFKKKGQ